MSLSVIIPTCNRPQWLERCVGSVQAAIAHSGRVDVEVIVSDDSAGDETRNVLENYPGICWQPGPRRGPASNRNAGVRSSQGRWILFVDDDCVVDRGWIAAFLVVMTSLPLCRVLEGRTVADRPRRRMDEESPINETGGYLWSCNMAIARTLFDELGGFCESFPYASMEDVDLRLRLQGMGEHFPFVADALVCHPLRSSKGVGFMIKSGRSYLHLISRHPELVAQPRWLGWCMNSCRRFRNFLVDAYRCQFRGVPQGAANLFIGIYFEFVARLRYDGARVVEP
jgi:GT2 family glycosyltransferase